MNKEIFVRSPNGFTLIELLVVIAIIGILSAVAFPVYNGYKSQANKNVTVSNMNDLLSLIKTKMLECEAKNYFELMTVKDSKQFNRVSCDMGTGYMTPYFENHMFNAGYKNPYNSDQPAVVCCGRAYSKGQTYVGVSGNSPGNSSARWWFNTKISDLASEDISSGISRASKN